jgi:hypothetical protein
MMRRLVCATQGLATCSTVQVRTATRVLAHGPTATQSVACIAYSPLSTSRFFYPCRSDDNDGCLL